MRKLLSLSALIVLIDQLSKVLVKGFDLFGLTHAGMQPYEQRQVLGDVVRFTYVENPGMAFGLNFDMPVVLSFFSILASAFLVYLIYKTERDGMSGMRIALALILGGAVGNLIDRVFYGVFYGYSTLFHGRVVDFIDIDIPDINLFGLNLQRFYVFNIADAAVTIGVILLLIYYPSQKEQPTTAPAPTPDNADRVDRPSGSLPHEDASYTSV